jgi:cation diffusion facilitator CzcD-associated flavoprotein CzcO
MVTNQSKHTVQFSDLSWDDTAPQLPRAYQVGQYLDTWRRRYAGADLQLGHKVVRTELQDGGSWKVETESQDGCQTGVFDYLLVATGFFGEPIWPDCFPRHADIPIMHSSRYRDITDLLRKHDGPGGKILVVGGQMSGIEIASTIASHLSSAINSPGGKPVSNPERYSIHHVTPQPSWVFPLFTSPKASLTSSCHHTTC